VNSTPSPGRKAHRLTQAKRPGPPTRCTIVTPLDQRRHLSGPKLDHMRLGVLDLGSNTFHLLLAEIEDGGSIAKLGSCKRAIKLGAEVPAGGVIGETHWQRAMAAVEDLVAYGRPFECRTVGVATSVFRDAANGRAFIEAVRAQFGIPVELLTGIEEARLSYLGATSQLRSSHGRAAVIDVGGGSIQLTVGEGERCLLAMSLPLGVLRLREAALSRTFDMRAAMAAVKRIVRSEARLATDAILALNPAVVVFASGTARTIASLSLLDACESSPPPRWVESAGSPAMATCVSRTGIARLAATIVNLDGAALSRLGVPLDRHDTVGPGAVVLETLMDLLGIEKAMIATRALREGVMVRASRVPRWGSDHVAVESCLST
jgi:exopolyphosphatase / guanosine-5'-triphosphate,3'-diphosphate pyrophosphatase